MTILSRVAHPSARSLLVGLRGVQARRLLSTSQPFEGLKLVGPRPPFSVRVALVGTSVGLATPIFATVGVGVAWSRLLPNHPLIRGGLVVALGGGLGTIVYHYIGPFLSEHSEVVLPFAAANGITAMMWYSLLEFQVNAISAEQFLFCLPG